MWTKRHPIDCQPLVEVQHRANQAALAGTLIHEYAHALLHFETEDASERSKREVEAEAVAYVVGRHFELDMGGSGFYLAAWESDDSTAVRDRLARISNSAQENIETAGSVPEVSTN